MQCSTVTTTGRLLWDRGSATSSNQLEGASIKVWRSGIVRFQCVRKKRQSKTPSRRIGGESANATYAQRAYVVLTPPQTRTILPEGVSTVPALR